MLVIMVMDEDDPHGRVMSGRVDPEIGAQILYLMRDVLVDGRDVDLATKVQAACEQPGDVPVYPVGELVPGSVGEHLH
jgi:hypothetical protein